MMGHLRLSGLGACGELVRAFLLLAALLGFVAPAVAQGAYVQQVEGTISEPLLSAEKPRPHSGPTGLVPAIGSYFVGSQLAEHGTRGNVARSFVHGNQNQVYVAQAGKGNKSNVGVFNGEENLVGVFQKGKNLSSNVGLVNTRGLIVLVPQKQGSAPVNLWAIGLKSGGLMILR